MSERGRRVARGAAVWALVFALTYGSLLTRRLDRIDEAWILWVGERLARGDRLYRDVYDVTTPLAAWMVGIVVWVGGAHLALLRVLTAAVFALEVVVALSVTRACGVERRANAGLAVALFAFGSPVVAFVNLYTALALLGGLIAMRGIVWWFAQSDDRMAERRSLVMVGVGLAFAFWSKPNIGVLAGVAVAVAILIGCERPPGRRLARAALIIGGAFGVVGAVVIVAIVATGAWSAFVDQVFMSKGQYVEVGFSYLSAVSGRIDALGRGGAHGDAQSVVQLGVILFPLVAGAALAVGGWRAGHGRKRLGIALFAFGVAGLLGMFPRPGVNHVAAVVPLVLPATFGLWKTNASWQHGWRGQRVGALAAIVVVVVSAIVVAGSSVRPWFDGSRLRADPFWPAPLGSDSARRPQRLATALQRHGAHDVFIARQDAGYFYLLTGARDPLPFDIVERSDFGAAGERGVIRRLQRGDAAWVCLRPSRSERAHDPLVAVTLERWVRAQYDPVAQLPSCHLYRVPGSRVGGQAPSRPDLTASATAS